jgi:peptide/nickel transport system substrate-binding protein
LAPRCVACLVLLALAASCREAPPPPPERTLTLAVRGDVTSFFPNPPGLGDTYTRNVNASIFEGLVKRDRELSLVPALAESWSNPDPLTFVFVLRPGLRFSNGQPLTARDVVASIEGAVRHRWETRDFLYPMTSVRALDERRVEIRTRVLTVNFLSRLPAGFVVPQEMVDLDPVPTVGSGPYLLDRWSPGREIRLSRNPHFRGPAPAFAQVRYVIVPDDRARVDWVARGDADAADQASPQAMDALRGRGDLRVITRDNPEALFLCLRTDRRPFADPRVRQAVHLSLDRQELVRRALAGRAQPANQIVPRPIVGHDPDLKVPEVDRDRARALLREAGYPHGFDLRLDGPFNRYVNDRQILEELARQLREVGVRATANAVDKVDFYKLIDSGRSDAHLLGWYCATGDAGDVLEGLLHTPAGGMVGAWNTLGWSDPELDRLIDLSNGAGAVERYRHLRQAMNRVAELRPVLPLVFPTVSFVVSSRIDWDPPLDTALRPEDARPAPPAAAPASDR